MVRHPESLAFEKVKSGSFFWQIDWAKPLPLTPKGER
jgi:hypothetical protein